MPIRPEERSRYPKDWPLIRERIRKRAGDKCEFCGVPNHCYIKRDSSGWQFALQFEDGAVYIVCTTMHLDHTPENCADENLRFACQKCHNSYDAKHRAEGIRRRMDQKTLPLFKE